MINRYSSIIIFVMCSHLSAYETIGPKDSESYFNKTLHEIKAFDQPLRKALSDTNWDAAYMYFISYFKKPSVIRVQNMQKSLAIIQDRIDILDQLLTEKKDYLATQTKPVVSKRSGGFDLFDTKDAMTLFGAIVAAPFLLLGSALQAYSIQNLKIGIEKTEGVLDALNAYKKTLIKYL